MKENTTMKNLLPFTGNSIIELIRFRTQHQTDDVAYIHIKDKKDKKETITYGEFEQRIKKLAAKLQLYDVQGERIVLMYPSGIDYIVAYFAVIFSGAIAVPVYEPRQSNHLNRLTNILEDASPKLLLMSDKTVTVTNQELMNELTGYGAELLITDQPEFKLPPAESWQPVSLENNDIVFLQYTSGSTGNPKGVMVSHGNILHNSQKILHATEPDASFCCVSWLPPYHDMGLIGGLIQPLYAGYPCIIMSPISVIQRPIKLLKAIHEYKATISGGPNFIFDACVNRIRDKQLEGIDLSSWRIAFNGAEPINAHTIKRFSDRFKQYGFDENAHYPCYGMAESTLFISGSRVKNGAVVRQFDKKSLQNDHAKPATQGNTQMLVSSGYISQNMGIKIINPENNIECKEFQVGEVWIRGDSVAQGYWKQEEKPGEDFSGMIKGKNKHRYLRTGDLAFFCENELFITGRIKDVIIIHGKNYYPQDIEYSITNAHPEIKPGSGAAFSVDHEGNERLVILQELNHRLDEHQKSEIREIIRSEISQHHEVQILDIAFIAPGRLPKTTSGKIQRQASKTVYLTEYYSDFIQTSQFGLIANF